MRDNASRPGPALLRPGGYAGWSARNGQTSGRTSGWRSAAGAVAAQVPAPVWRGIERGRQTLRGGGWPYTIAAFHRVWDGSRDELSYPPAAFEALCRYWRDHYEILSLERLLMRLARGTRNPHPCLVITFDDGYADNAEIAAPILDRLELSAAFFITSGYVGTGHRFFWDRELAAAPRMMDADQVRELSRAGFGIGSHTATHARVSATPAGELRRELEDSRRDLEAMTGGPVVDFAYPFGGAGDCGAAGREAARSAGYRCCLSCHGGLVRPGDSPFELNRVCASPRHHATPAAWERNQWLAAGRMLN